MSGWGLLSGLGRGLNNAAVTLNAGMAEDRRARIEAQREANAEKWRQKAHQMQIDQFNTKKEWRAEDRAAEEKRYQAKREDVAYTRQMAALERDLDRVGEQMREQERAVAGMFDNQLQSVDREIQALLRVRDSGDIMSALQDAKGETRVTDPAEVSRRINYLYDVQSDLTRQRVTKLGELASEHRSRLSEVAGAYDPDLISQSSYRGYMSHINRLTAEAEAAAKAAAGHQGNDDPLTSNILSRHSGIGSPGSLGSPGSVSTTAPTSSAVADPTNPPPVAQGNGLLQQLDGRLARTQRELALAQSTLDSGAIGSSRTAEKRIADLKAEEDRLMSLQQNWQGMPQSTGVRPTSTDWRNDPEYLNRMNHFR